MKTVRPRLCCRLADQLVEVGGADRVEARGRLVEEQNLGIERQRPRQARRASSCRRRAPRGTCRRHRAAGRPWRSSGPPARRSWRAQMGVLLERHLDVLGTVSELNSAPFWNSTPQRSSSCSPLALGQALDVLAAAPRCVPAAGRLSPTMVRSSTDLPVPEPPTTPITSPRRTSRSRPSCTTCCRSG